MPIKSWERVSKESSLLPLVKRGYPPKNLKDIWFSLQDQYTARYGTTKEYEAYILALKRAVELKSQFIKSEKRYLLNEIDRLDLDIEEASKNTHPLELKDILPKMSKYYGYPVKDSISVSEFFDMLNNMNNG